MHAGPCCTIGIQRRSPSRPACRQLRLVHLEPRPRSRSVGAEVHVHRNDQITIDEVHRLQPTHRARRPRTPSAPVILESAAPSSSTSPPHPCWASASGTRAGRALGGRVIHAPAVMHGKTSPSAPWPRSVCRTTQPDAGDALPQPLVERESLPDSLAITAETEDGLIMAAHRSRPGGGCNSTPRVWVLPTGPGSPPGFSKWTQHRPTSPSSNRSRAFPHLGHARWLTCPILRPGRMSSLP